MQRRSLYNNNKPLKAAAVATLVLGFQIFIGLSTGWIIVTVLFTLLTAPCLAMLVYYLVKWFKVQKMSDEEYVAYIENEKIKRGDAPKEDDAITDITDADQEKKE